MKLILITNSFPYHLGEQFIETEIQYLAQFETTIIPVNVIGISRNIPKGIKVDLSFAKFHKESNKPLRKFNILLSLFVQRFFWEEIFLISRRDFGTIRSTIGSLFRFYISRLFFKRFIVDNKLEEVCFYTYWNNETTHALESLKGQFNFKLISRIHGGDLYEDRKRNNYFPLKRSYNKNIDHLYVLSSSAKKYLTTNYNYSAGNISISRLGVEDKGIYSSCGSLESLSIVSCSSLIPLKRVHLIIDLIQLISRKKYKIKWTHIGDGYLKKNLLQYAQKHLENIDNVDYNFLGELENKEVYKFYKNNEIDLFVTMSESEGAPVSIMEALSFGIPIVATDVGGISEMVINGYNGFLINHEKPLKEVVMLFEDIEFFKNPLIRRNSKQLFRERFNAKINYNLFVERLILL